MNVASRRRLLVLYVVAAAMLISLGGRLYYLQVMNTTAFTKLAAANQTRDVIVPAVRGQILDDVGNRLVTNQTALVVSVDMMNAVPAARRRRARPAPAGPAARHVQPAADRKDAAVHRGRPAALLGGLALPAHPGGPERLRPGGAAGDGGAEGVPRGDRAGPAGDRLPGAGRGQPGSGARLPAADHPAGDQEQAPAGDRLLRRGPGRPGRPGGPVRQPAPRPGGHPGGVGQRRRGRHRHRQPDLASQRRRPRDQPQRADPGRHPERAQRCHRPVAGGREQTPTRAPRS